MKLTTFTDYNLRVLMYLATFPERRVTISEIAQAFDISVNHLMKVAQWLGRNGWLDNVRGRGGGLRLVQPPEKIVIGHVVRESEGTPQMAECFDESGCHCAIAPWCELKGVLGGAVESFYANLDQYTLADVVSNRDQLARILAPAKSKKRS